MVAFYTGVLAGCVPPQPQPAERVELLLIPGVIGVAAGMSPVPAPRGSGRRVPLTPNSTTASRLIRIDVNRAGRWVAEQTALPADSFPYSARAALIVFGGPSRDAAALLRLLKADSGGRRRAEAALRTVTASDSLQSVVFLPGPVSLRDREAMLLALDDLAGSARLARAGEVAVAVAGGDTAGYPSRPIAAIADALLVDVSPPAPLASPGPPVTIEGVREAVGLRGAEVGRGRLILLLPVHGYAWPQDSLPRAITFDEGVRLAGEWRATLRRDDASQALFARVPGRGELWLVDARLVAVLARESRGMGIRRFAVVLGAGEDLAVGDSLASALQTTSRSR